ncbi:PEPxxWA-CTERM sorting domain-containing protein [Duganella vulcania]|uniref:PEPxxWA-CTERM sorting domain-containing protein n=1 Tax=Duganella vulcania TaxID=2692166 RepID=UPI0020C32B10|nr:PEPxxWA-CTERM sorting domain-containing protein [Duganella vulcania]
MKNLLPKLAAAALLSASGLASATDCDVADLFFDVPGVHVAHCFGFVEGNVIDSSPADKALVSGILNNNFGFPGQSGAPIETINVSADHTSHITTYDFSHLLTGNVIVGLHFGNGQGGPGNGTAFYAFDAGSGIDKFYTLLQATSNAGLYRIGAPVPEPASYAMLLAGLGLVGAIARRRKARA